MKKSTVHRILDAQERLRDDPEYRELLEEYHVRNDQFLQCIRSLPRDQAERIMDYVGVLVDLHMRTMDFIIQQDRCPDFEE